AGVTVVGPYNRDFPGAELPMRVAGSTSTPAATCSSLSGRPSSASVLHVKHTLHRPTGCFSFLTPDLHCRSSTSRLRGEWWLETQSIVHLRASTLAQACEDRLQAHYLPIIPSHLALNLPFTGRFGRR